MSEQYGELEPGRYFGSKTTPDTKGAQPEQLTSTQRNALQFALVPLLGEGREILAVVDSLATALSECRERERTACEALRNIAYPDNWPDLKEYPSALDTWMQAIAASTLTVLAAQLPSEASEGSGT